MSTSTPVKDGKAKMEPREAGRVPPKKREKDGKEDEKSGSVGSDVQSEEGKEDDGNKDKGDYHLETWVQFLKRSRT